MENRTIRLIKDVCYKNSKFVAYLYSTVCTENNLMDSILVVLYDGENVIYTKEYLVRSNMPERYINSINETVREFIQRSEDEGVNKLFKWDGVIETK